MRGRLKSQRGNAILETALFVPIILTLLVGMVQLGKITYVYYTLRKTLYSMARYVATQQGVNFCDEADATLEAAKRFALTGRTEEGAAEPLLPQLTADMISVRIELVDAETGDIGECACEATGCDAAQGGQPPDYIVVSIPNGYEVRPRIPFLALETILLRPEVRVPFGGT
ncbi:MAG: pilus assembly protein [Acidobacteria bacterium]|nr:pilus assembly protein [Acidobacteriota bacterium]